ncbi:hypothetical protein C8R43DRAFT_953394 [Mycena crocata]|nr:hypothetical protein C8R43DRAFT_953394 [Mycena crocata]
MVKVLSVQTHPSKVEVHSLFQNKVIPMVVYLMKTFMKLGDLEVTTDWTTFCLGPQPVTVILDQDPKGRMLGAFKVANLGTTNPSIFDVPEICAKQTYYATRALTVVGTPATTQHVLHDAQRQGKLLCMETRCLAWGQVLLQIVYDFIRCFIREHGDPPFPIPQTCFVKAALATTNINGKPDLFLLEERIDPLVEGKFRKFMNNRSAVPIVYQDAEDCERAEFLSFTQHVQYWRTHKMVFVSDYQAVGKTGSLGIIPVRSHQFWSYGKVMKASSGRSSLKEMERTTWYSAMSGGRHRAKDLLNDLYNQLMATESLDYVLQMLLQLSIIPQAQAMVFPTQIFPEEVIKKYSEFFLSDFYWKQT